MHKRFRLPAVGFFLILLWPFIALASPQVEIFQLENRDASELLQHLTPLFPDQEATFSADGQRLIVKAEPQVLNQVQQLVNRLDVAPVQLRISVRQASGSQREQAGTRVTTTETRSTRHLVVQSGEAAHISAGTIRRIPTAIQGGENPGMITEPQSLESGFMVQPKSLGSQQVELKIVTFENSAAGGADTETAALVSIRRVAPGEWVSLGGTQEESASNRTGRVYDTGSRQQQGWEMKVEVLP